MMEFDTYEGDPRSLSPVALAFLGDAVYELMVRAGLLRSGTMPAGKLHGLAVKRVSAAAQARCYDTVADVLSEEEHDILRRGRNAHTARAPKSCTPEDYRKATAIEALFGYLYLKGDTTRLAALYDLMQRTISGGE